MVTAAGIGNIMAPHELQERLVAFGAVQCGFCSPGLVVTAASLLEGGDAVDETAVRRALDAEGASNSRGTAFWERAVRRLSRSV